MRVRCDNQYKNGADGKNILGQPMLFECMGICVLGPVHQKCNEGLPCLSADCKTLTSLILFKFGHSILDWTALTWIFFFFFVGGTFSEGSVDHI